MDVCARTGGTAGWLLFSCLAVTSLAITPVSAQTSNPSGRTFVSGTGQDTGTCARSAPCRSFAYAIGKTSAGGEIVALDPAGYGTVSISQSITITGPGTGLAQITVPSGGTGINVSGSSATVILRGIEIDDGGGGQYGINLAAFSSLIVENSVVRGTTYGILSFAGGNVTITNSTIADSGDVGMYLPSASLFITRSKVSGAGNIGLSVGGLELVGCTIVNSPTGVSINGSGVFKGSLIAGNNIGVTLASYSTARFDTTTITNNGTGIQAINTSPTLISYGNNNFVANGSNISPPGAPLTTVAPN